MEIKLRPYQEKLVKELRGSFAEGFKSPLLVLPTGGGKTFVFAYITLLVKARGFKVLILTHREELWQQASDSLDALGIEHGIIAPKFGYSPDPVKVASIQTLVRRMEKIPDYPDFIIIDEAHHATTLNMWGKIIEKYPNANILGVTATASRLDGTGLGVKSGGVFDKMVLGPHMIELQQMGFLCEYDYYLPPTKGIDLSDVDSVGGDWAKGKLGKAMDKPVITGCAVDHYNSICPGEPAIAFCASVAHAQHVAEQFKESGYKAICLDGKMDKTQRKAAIKALGEGNLDVITSCDIISEGTDIPIVTVAILLRPTKSLGLFLQQVGRVLRPAPGKDKAIILDHVGNFYLHGHPNKKQDWDLNATKKTRRRKKDPEELEPLQYKTCEKCFKPFTGGSSCPHCGHIHVVKTRELTEKEGTLEKIEDEKQRKIKANRREQGKATTLVDLLLLAKRKGHKEGWAKHIYKSRGGKLTHEIWENAKLEMMTRS